MATELARRVRLGERAAIAEALNLTDDRRPEQQRQAEALLSELADPKDAGATPRVGLTGAPGAGKSTLLEALSRGLRARGATVGIIAVDPSSRRTGGALLGDRIRVRSGSRDSGIFFRSMAAREQLGGLAAATRAGVTILEVAFDWVLVETVGVGQAEADVAHLVDTLVYVAQPGAGDLLQFMKAGLLEHPDLFVVNKADLGAVAEQTASELRAGLALAERASEAWEPPVLLVSSRDGQGIDALIAALEAHRKSLEGEPLHMRRRLGRDHFVLDELARRYGSFGLEALGGVGSLREHLAAHPEDSEFRLLEVLSHEIEQALSGSRS